MPYSLEDLTEVMEDRSADGRPSPDLLTGVRRRIRRNNRRRAAGGAAGAALAVAATFGAVQQFGQAAGDGAPPAMTGVVDAGFTKSPPKEGMDPAREVRFRMAGAKAEIRFDPAGPNSVTAYRCSARFTIYEVRNGSLGSFGCDASGSGESYLRTAPGKPETFSVVALPIAAPRPSSAAELDRYLAAHEPFPATWSVRIYSGTCTSSTCRFGEVPRRGQIPVPSVEGLDPLARTTRTADGRPRTIAYTPSGTTVRLRLTCLDGAAVAVLKGPGPVKIVECEVAESAGVVLDLRAEPGTRNMLDVAVLPAEAGPLTREDAVSLAELMKGVRPAGTWTLEVYER